MAGRDMQIQNVKPAHGVSPMVIRTVCLGSETVQVRLEPSYWEALDDICQREELTVDELCSDLKDRLDRQMRRAKATDGMSMGTVLANAMRVFIVGYYRQAATETGHDRAGHGHGSPFISTPFDRNN